MNNTTIPARTNGMRISTAGKCAWRAVYLHGVIPCINGGYPLEQLRCSIGIDPNIGTGRTCQVFGQFGRWRFRLNLPQVSFLFAYRHKWALPLYRLNMNLLHKIDRRFK